MRVAVPSRRSARNPQNTPTTGFDNGPRSPIACNFAVTYFDDGYRCEYKQSSPSTQWPFRKWKQTYGNMVSTPSRSGSCPSGACDLPATKSGNWYFRFGGSSNRSALSTLFLGAFGLLATITVGLMVCSFPKRNCNFRSLGPLETASEFRSTASRDEFPFTISRRSLVSREIFTFMRPLNALWLTGLGDISISAENRTIYRKARHSTTGDSLKANGTRRKATNTCRTSAHSKCQIIEILYSPLLWLLLLLFFLFFANLQPFRSSTSQQVYGLRKTHANFWRTRTQPVHHFLKVSSEYPTMGLHHLKLHERSRTVATWM